MSLISLGNFFFLFRLLADQSRGQSRFARKTVVRLGSDIVQELLERRAAAVPL